MKQEARGGARLWQKRDEQDEMENPDCRRHPSCARGVAVLVYMVSTHSTISYISRVVAVCSTVALLVRDLLKRKRTAELRSGSTEETQ